MVTGFGPEQAIGRAAATPQSESANKIPEMVKYLDLKKINERIRFDIICRLKTMLDEGRYIGGQWNKRFCGNFADYCGTAHALGVGNGLDALRIILQASGFGHGDEIIVPGNTFIATILAINQAGCTPVLAEPDPKTFNINPEGLEQHITSRTKAIMAVHLYGRVAPMDRLREIADRYGLKLFEDAAQAHGAILGTAKAGNLSDAAAFSFYPGKNLGCLGDGGAITSSDGDFIRKAEMIANYGSERKYEHWCKGCNSRLDDFQAAVLDLKLENLDKDNEKRRQIAKYYAENIANPLIRLPAPPENPAEHVWHIYAVRVPAMRDAFIGHMRDMGVETLVHYPTPPHHQHAFRELWHLELPITEAIHREVVSLPLNPVLEDREMEKIVEAANAWK